MLYALFYLMLLRGLELSKLKQSLMLWKKLIFTKLIEELFTLLHITYSWVKDLEKCWCFNGKQMEKDYLYIQNTLWRKQEHPTFILLGLDHGTTSTKPEKLS